MALFFRGRPDTGGGEQRATELNTLVDAATGGRRGLAGGTVGWGSALSVPAVWAAVRLRANIVSSLPVQVYRDRGGTPVRVPSPGVLEQPSSEFDMVSWLHASQVSLDLRGNAYGRIVSRDPVTSLPTQVELVHPDDVTVTTRRDGSIEYRFGGKQVDRLDVWHERQNEVPGSIVGMSPIAAAAQSLGISLAAEHFGAGFYNDGAHPSALLSSDSPIDESAARIAKARYLGTLQGREPLVLGGNWRYTPLSVNPAESAFLDVMKYSAEQVARLFDVPGEMIGAPASGSSVTYANREQRMQDLLALRLGPMIARRERALSRLTVRGQYVKLNVAALLRSDLPTRYASYEKALHNGFLTLDEVRALEEREPMPADALAQLQQLGLLARSAGAEAVGQTGMTAEQLRAVTDIAGALMRAGYDPASVSTMLGLAGIDHTGWLPVTIKPPASVPLADDPAPDPTGALTP